MIPDSKAHWDGVYSNRSPESLSWFQAEPALSIALIRQTGISADASVIDVGGGASTLVDCLVQAGFTDLTVLDISGQALEHSKDRLGSAAKKVNWIESEITRFAPDRKYALWHDRAVFHFLTQGSDRKAYVSKVKESLQTGGHLIIATFSLDGPKKCSGLEIIQYDSRQLCAELGDDFKLIGAQDEAHVTPQMGEQNFTYFYFEKVS